MIFEQDYLKQGDLFEWNYLVVSVSQKPLKTLLNSNITPEKKFIQYFK